MLVGQEKGLKTQEDTSKGDVTLKRRKSNTLCFFSIVFLILSYEKSCHHHLQSSKDSIGFFEGLLTMCCVRKADRNVHDYKTKVLEPSQPSSLTNVKFFLVDIGNLSYLEVEGEAIVPTPSLTSKGSFSIREISDHLLPKAKAFISK